MSLGDTITFAGGSYEIRGMVDGRYVVRIRDGERNIETYKVWTETEMEQFDRAQDARNERKDRNCQIYERRLSGETLAALGRDFDLSPTSISQICAKQARKEKRSKK